MPASARPALSHHSPGALGGRLDHTLSALSTLHAHRAVSLVLLGDDNLARLVPAGRAIIRPNRRVEGPSCGLVPVAGPAVASSRCVVAGSGGGMRLRACKGCCTATAHH